jgi:hypothetical protein
MALSSLASAFSIACWQCDLSSAWARGAATKNISAAPITAAITAFPKGKFKGVLLSISVTAYGRRSCEYNSSLHELAHLGFSGQDLGILLVAMSTLGYSAFCKIL